MQMNKKLQEREGKNLLQQFYSRLNISWAENSSSETGNPILRKTENHLMSKSIVQKIYNSKRNKLNCNTKEKTKKKQSAHIFTTCGITTNYLHKRRNSEPSAIHLDTKQNRVQKFLKYENSALYQASKEAKLYRTCYLPQNCSKLSCSSVEKQPQLKSNRTFRAMSAHLSSRRPRLSIQEPANMRKTSQNWSRRQIKKQEKEEVKGWDIDLDHLDINLIEFRVHTQQ